VQQTIAVDPLRVYDVAVSPLVNESGSAQINYQVSETMKVAVKIYKPSTQFDSAGNPTPPEAVSLVKRMVGVRAARSQVNEVWDGRDERLTMLPDGNYVFRIVASTDINAIDSITGSVVPGASLAEDLIVAEVPVIRSLSTNPQADFINNTFMYPNPVSGSQATFNIFLPFQSDVNVKIFNIAGELVYERSFSNQAPTINNPSGALMFNWARTNSSGRQVAPGVYFVLIREQETFGGANVLQTIKKMLVQ
jgi:flagellar hook assembly protein FlgD